jgi:hypothetical protein
MSEENFEKGMRAAAFLWEEMAGMKTGAGTN